jgi:long-chain acyl-CoA synthetase
MNEYLSSNGCQFKTIKGYGMTELASGAVTASPIFNALGSVGAPLVTNTLKITEVGTNQELGYNCSGEIWISSPSIMLGYYSKPEATAEIIHTEEDGTRWIRTGDLGYITEDGLLFHQGRIRRIYLTSYEGQPAKIFPMLVEEKIKQAAGISNCVVVARLQENSANYEAVAFVISNGADRDKLTDELKTICFNEVPTYMQPVEYRYVEEFPHTPVGKIDFRALECEAQQPTEG